MVSWPELTVAPLATGRAEVTNTAVPVGPWGPVGHLGRTEFSRPRASGGTAERGGMRERGGTVWRPEAEPGDVAVGAPSRWRADSSREAVTPGVAAPRVGGPGAAIF